MSTGAFRNLFMIVYLDTNIVIYAVENPPIWGAKALAKLATLRGGGNSFMISDLTRMECLVGPFTSGDVVVEGEFRAFFAATGMQVASISPAVCDQAATIRASFHFKPMDALHLSAALLHGANVFLTNDTRLNSFTALAVEILP
jgi:predicted nucleic acid-binding protein